MNKIQLVTYNKSPSYFYVVNDQETTVPYLGHIPGRQSSGFGPGIFYFANNVWDALALGTRRDLFHEDSTLRGRAQILQYLQRQEEYVEQ